MSLKQDLKNLKKQKRLEVHNLHYTYLRTKRDIKRQASPARLVRKHLGASMGIAAVLGLLLAPRPSTRATEKEIEKAAKKVAREADRQREHGPSLTDRITQLVHNALGQLQHLVPNPNLKAEKAQAANGHAKPANPKMSGFLQTLLTVLVGRVDLTRLISELSRNVMGKTQAHKSNGHHPSVSVADVGTVKPDQMEDFQ